MALIDLEVKIPQELSAIKLKDYQKYLGIANKVKEDNNNNDFLNLKALEIFCGLTLKESYGLPVSMFESVLKQLSDCFEEKTGLVNRFTMTDSNGVTIEFGFIPKLDDISMGEYVDLEKYISDWDTMHKAMAVMYRPIVAGKGGNYVISDYEGSDKWSEVMKDAPVNVALGSIIFFYRLGKKLSKYTMNSLMEEAQKSKESSLSQQVLAENGDGINQYMDLQDQMFAELMRLPKFHYTLA